MNTDSKVVQLRPDQLDDAAVKHHDLVARYVAGQLSPNLAAAFEEYYLDRPDIVARIRVEKALRDGLQAEADALEQAKGSFSWHRALPYAAAILFAIPAALGVWSFGELRHLQREMASLSDAVLDSRVPKVALGPILLDVTRGVSRSIKMPLQGQLQPLLVGVSGGRSYDVEIRNESGLVVWDASGLVPDAASRLQVMLGPESLSPSRYVLVVRPADTPIDDVVGDKDDAPTAAEFTFQLTGHATDN